MSDPQTTKGSEKPKQSGPKGVGTLTVEQIQEDRITQVSNIV